MKLTDKQRMFLERVMRDDVILTFISKKYKERMFRILQEGNYDNEDKKRLNEVGRIYKKYVERWD